MGMKVTGDIHRGDMVILYYKSGEIIMGEYYNRDGYIIALIRNTILTGKGEQFLNDVYEQTEIILTEAIWKIQKLEDETDLKELYYSHKWI